MPAKAGYPPPATTLVPLAQAGELSLKAYRAEAAQQSRDGKLEKTKSKKASANFIEKHCRSDVSEEWKKVDDGKIAKLRGILAALQEENQSTQLLKKESEDKEARRELEATRSSVDMRLGACKEKEALFVKKQAALRQHVLENEKSLEELETNIEKGEKKSKDEQAECRRLDTEIRSLERDLDEQEVLKSTEQKKIERTSQYKRFLEVVVQECEEDFEGDIENLMNRHNTLEAGNAELHQANAELTSRLSRVREECLRVQTKLQNEHLMISSKLHECQVTLDRNRAESQELEQRLNRALEEKELKESQVGVIQMAIGQLFTRTVHSCRLQQRKKAMLDATDVKFAPVRGDSGGMSDVRLEEMLRQIIERVEDLRDMYDMAKEELGKADTTAQVEKVVDEAVATVKFVVSNRADRPAGQEHGGEDQTGLAGGQSAGMRKASAMSAGSGPQAVPVAETPAPRQETFVTQE
mmetsp:Transcript_49611/g.106227  ORF Transcript_49611/g.106227 Transcript_49611/m.106227 type:complete len:468 (+) Transcript_49611:53-1456(+)